MRLPNGAVSHVLILEKNPTGHRLYYARILANGAATAGHRVTLVLSSGAAQSPELSIHLSGLDERVERVYNLDFTYGGVVELSHRLDATLTVISDGDSMAVDVGRRARWSGQGVLSVLVMRESAQPTRVPGLMRVKTHLKQALLRRARSVPGVRVTVLKGALWRGKSKFAVARDPVTLETTPDLVQSVRSRWGLSDDIYWFGVLGAISERKNLALIADALTALNKPGMGLLVAGTCDPCTMRGAYESLESLRQTGVPVVIVDRLLEDWELDSAVAAIDAVVLAHSNEGPSGLFGKAVAAGTRIVAAGARSLKKDAAGISTLAIWSPLKIAPLSACLKQTLLESPGVGQPDLGPEEFVRALL